MYDIYAIDSDVIWRSSDSWSDVAKGTNVIYIFGRTDDKRKVIKRLSAYKPYFYIKETDTIPENLSQYLTKTESDKSDITFKVLKSLDDIRVKKVSVRNMRCLPIMRKELEARGIMTYEADVQCRLSFTRDMKVPFEERHITFNVDKCRVFVLDIETTTSHSDFPDPGNTPENIISIALHDSYTNIYHAFVWRRDFIEDVIMTKTTEGDELRIHTWPSEVDMLNDFLRFWQLASPDIVVGWHIDGFDMPYIMNRCKMLKLPFQKLSPINRAWIWEDRKEGRETYYNPQISGLVVFDSLKWYREVVLNEMRGYSLESVAKDEGLGVKGKINPETAWIENWQQLIEYNVNDVILTKKITDKKKLIDFVSGIRKVTMANFDDLVFFSRAIDMLLILRAKELEIVLPTKPTIINYQNKEEREAQYQGAHVFAEKGLYKNVGVFDFNSLYPRIIQTFNLSKELISENQEGRELNNVYFRTDRRGITPDIVDMLINLREKYEITLKSAKSSKEAEEADNLIQATKNLICTLYGVHANPSFRMFDQRVASTITYIGRELIQEMINHIKETKGFKAVYCDTDSLFVELDDFSVDTGMLIQDMLNAHIKEYVQTRWNIPLEENILSLKFEKLYQSLLVDTKKRYAGWIKWKKGKDKDDIQVVGMQARRSDASTQTHELQTRVLELILKGKTREDVETLIFSEVKKINTKNVNYEYIAIPTKFGKVKYENDLPRVRALEYAKKLLNLTILPGMKMLLLYIDNNESDAICIERNEDLQNKEIKINKLKMVERNILMPLENILILSYGEKYFNDLTSKIKNSLNGQETLCL